MLFPQVGKPPVFHPAQNFLIKSVWNLVLYHWEVSMMNVKGAKAIKVSKGTKGTKSAPRV